jgi:hypothetical protein
MPSTNDEEVKRGLFAMFKGESGSGKSVAAFSFPNIYHFDLDKKMPAIAKKHFPGKAITYDSYQNVFDIASKLREFEVECPYETLVFDTITALAKLTMRTIAESKGESFVERLKPSNLSKGTSASAKTGKVATSIDMMSVDYYNGVYNFMIQYWIDALKGLWIKQGNPKHVLVLAHVMTTESSPDLKTKQTITTRNIISQGKKVEAELPTLFDEIYHFESTQPSLGDGSPIYLARTSNYGQDFAKTAYNLPAKIDFTMKGMDQAGFYGKLTDYIQFD